MQPSVPAEKESLQTFETSAGMLSRAWRWLRTRQLARSSSRRLQVAETVSLGEKRFVAVVQVDGRHFLLAGGPANIALLAQLNETEPFEDVLKKTMTVPPKQIAQRKRKKKEIRLEKALKKVGAPAASNPREAFAGVLKGSPTTSKTGSKKQPAKKIAKSPASAATLENAVPQKNAKTVDTLLAETVTVSPKRTAKQGTKQGSRQGTAKSTTRPAFPGDPADVSPLNTQKAGLTFDQWLKRTATGADMRATKPAANPPGLEKDLADVSRYTPANGTPTLDNWLLKTTGSPEKKPVKQVRQRNRGGIRVSHSAAAGATLCILLCLAPSAQGAPWTNGATTRAVPGVMLSPTVSSLLAYAPLRLSKAPQDPNELRITGIGSGSPQWTIFILLTFLTLLPSILICTTPFARLLIVFHFLRQALGLQTTPSNQTLVGLSVIMTFFLMQPTGEAIYRDSVVPFREGSITAIDALVRGGVPMRQFMSHYVREQDVTLFLEIAKAPRPEGIDDVPFRVLLPAYILSELKAGFQIGAVLFLPFLVVDMVVASITTSVGMVQLPPVVISTPLKLLLFLMVDGWHILIGALMRSFN